MGAQHVEAVEEYSHATDKTLQKYDLIVVADDLQDKIKRKPAQHKALAAALIAAEKNGVMMINQRDFKMSMACGKLLKTS